LQSFSIISVKEARKILGKESVSFSDKSMEELINSLDSIALEYLNLVPSAIIISRKYNKKGSK